MIAVPLDKNRKTVSVSFGSALNFLFQSEQRLADIDCPATRALRQVYEETLKLLQEVTI